jgi:hypothetical protein
MIEQEKQSQRNEQVRLETELQNTKKSVSIMEQECIGRRSMQYFRF